MIDELVLVPGILALLVITGLAALIDTIGYVRARRTATGQTAGLTCDNFHVLVPIYGSIRYLRTSATSPPMASGWSCARRPTRRRPFMPISLESHDRTGSPSSMAG